MPRAPKVTDEGQAETGGDVVGAGDETGLVAPQVEPPLDGGDHCVDEAVDDHSLDEGGNAKEKQHPARGVKNLDGFWCQSTPATLLIGVGRDQL